MRARARNALQLQSTMGTENNVAGYEMHLGKSLVAVTPTQDYISQTRLVLDEGRHEPDRDEVFHWAFFFRAPMFWGRLRLAEAALPIGQSKHSILRAHSFTVGME